MLTVKQIAEAAGISGRTIRHYDSIGLLAPTRTNANGYRYYGEAAILRLQQILFYRELGFSLGDIKEVLSRKEFDRIEALRRHRRELKNRILRLNVLIETVDETIQHLNEGTDMKAEDVFKGFTKEEQEVHEIEAGRIYDPEIVRDSNRRWKSYPKEKQAAILKESNEIYDDFKEAISEGAESETLKEIVGRWRRNLNYFWTPSEDQLVALAQSYSSDPRFKEKFDRMDPRLAEFIFLAVKYWVNSQR